MLAFTIRKIVYNIPIYFAVVAIMMGLLRMRDPVAGKLGKNATKEDYNAKKHELGLDQPFHKQYTNLLGSIFTLSFDRELWNEPGVTVGEKLSDTVPRSLALTLPALVLTTLFSIVIAMISAFNRGRWLDRTLVFFAVLGMSILSLIHI